MVGRELSENYPKESVAAGEVLLEVVNLSSRGLFKDISFRVNAGKSLGFQVW